ncbi:unnamed protein product [Phaedon cochleariae]|uniref:Uncharacterized protein n=1 Tax=Phaedon cochleariae TaxID=80249 RepID=A0A9N9SEU0_PHACE|nr:unnamed protein product [Phaedon cochleariae]
MSGEIVVSETPNWLQELEAKREKRLKARLGHEAGAGAPCLKCGEKCPGLDLHFWRKCCKICKCPKEEHEVQDDDIYGWAQFQLLGSKPNKIKQKIVLPGKKDETYLDWTPKGNKETVDKYLKTLPPEQLPVIGSQAARERKQLLQKQIPIHDIDPNLCHELNEEELKQMNEYIAHVKQNSVGVGQIVSLSNIIKGNLHMLSPADAEIIAKRYSKGIPLSEIVKLQSQSMSGSLINPELSKNLETLSLNKRNLPVFHPKSLNQKEDIADLRISENVHDKHFPVYGSESNKALQSSQFADALRPKNYNKDNRFLPVNEQRTFDQTIDEEYRRNPNFDPKRPSQFNPQSVPYQPSTEKDVFLGGNISEHETGNSAFVPYQKASSNVNQLGESYTQQATIKDPSFNKNLERRKSNSSTDVQLGEVNIPSISQNHLTEDRRKVDPRYNKDQYGRVLMPTESKNSQDSQGMTSRDTNVGKYPQDLITNTEPSQHPTGQIIDHNFSQYGDNSGSQHYSSIKDIQDDRVYENVNHLRKQTENLPSYIPGKYNILSEQQTPMNIPKTFKDLAFSTYDADSIDPMEREAASNEFRYGQYRQPGSYNNGENRSNNSGVPINSREFRPIRTNDVQNIFEKNSAFEQSSANENSAPFESINNRNSRSPPNHERPYTNPSNKLNTPEKSSNDLIASEPLHTMNPSFSHEMPYSYKPNSFNTPQKFSGDLNEVDPMETENIENLSGTPNIPNKKLSEMLPVTHGTNEDFLYPSQVNIGLIQDINYPDIKAATHGSNDFYEEYSPDSIREIINNIKLPDCHYCKKPFEENEFAVAIDRAKALFHAGCFKCGGCNQILADNVYFYHKESDNVYCLRDYAKIRGFPRCKACDELIFTKEYCLADNSTFHLKHFCCTECDKPLAGQDYTLEEEMPYCLPCFEQSKASKCSSCCKVIKPDEVGCTLNGVHFHAVDECFACQICKIPLIGKKLLLRNEKLYCSHKCYQALK